ncbi:hypothetical protein C0J52_22426 [Blattella germanica]|nr:hypothetical protein C0J52_22426 [Blattella germanica]
MLNTHFAFGKPPNNNKNCIQFYNISSYLPKYTATIGLLEYDFGTPSESSRHYNTFVIRDTRRVTIHETGAKESASI